MERESDPPMIMGRERDTPIFMHPGSAPIRLLGSNYILQNLNIDIKRELIQILEVTGLAERAGAIDIPSSQLALFLNVMCSKYCRYNICGIVLFQVEGV